MQPLSRGTKIQTKSPDAKFRVLSTVSLKDNTVSSQITAALKNKYAVWTKVETSVYLEW